jgi:aminocarboxymuconate-semialdehyde decarboxylase
MTLRIDIHAHFVERFYYEALERLPGVAVEHRNSGLSFLLRNGRPWLPFRDEMFDPEEQLRDMDRKNIDLRILSLSTPSVYEFDPQTRIELCRQLNDRVIEITAKRPDRFRAFASLPLPDVDASLVELNRISAALEVVGITLGSNLAGMPLSDLSLERLWAAFDKLKIPVAEHPMVPVFAAAMDEFALGVRVGFVLDTSLAVSRMIYAGVFERYPNFPFIVAHTGMAFIELMERLDNGFRHYADCQKHITRLPSEFSKNFYYDSCSFFAPAIEMARNIFGPEQLMFGTDFPFIDQGPGHVEAVSIPRHEKDMILGGNAQRLFKLAKA